MTKKKEWEKQFDKLFTGELWLARPEDNTGDRQELKDFIKGEIEEAQRKVLEFIWKQKVTRDIGTVGYNIGAGQAHAQISEAVAKKFKLVPKYGYKFSIN